MLKCLGVGRQQIFLVNADVVGEQGERQHHAFPDARIGVGRQVEVIRQAIVFRGVEFLQVVSSGQQGRRRVIHVLQSAQAARQSIWRN